MVHISLPLRKKDNKQNGPTAPQTPRRPSPARQISGSTFGEQRLLTLRINVIRGRNLAPKDKSGTSDPYLVVNLGTSKQSTPSISKTLNPEWKTCFEMSLGEVPLVECICWDKDRWSKDYMGEFDIAVEDIFANGKLHQEPKWYNLKSKRRGNKKNFVSGEVQMQFTLVDTYNPTATEEDTLRRYRSAIAAGYEEEDEALSRTPTIEEDGGADDGDDGEHDHDGEKDHETSDETDEPAAKAAKKEKKKRKARLRRKSIAVRAYEFVGGVGDVSGIIFMEILKIMDLPPESNLTKTGFDMDPFVVTSLGRKVSRTKVIRHNLNPVYNEKIVFQVMRHEQAYTINFSVVDRDKLSGNDFIASTNLPVQKLITAAPDEDPDTGLYNLYDPPEYSAPPPKENKPRFRLPLSRSSSSSSLAKVGRPTLTPKDSQASFLNASQTDLRSDMLPPSPGPTSAPADGSPLRYTTSVADHDPQEGDPDMLAYTIPLELKNKERWEDKHVPQLYIKAKYLPYRALRQQFWRVMLKQYDADESKRVSRVELQTMLDTIGSTLRDKTIDGFFERFEEENEAFDTFDLTFEQVIICLEDQLQKTAQKRTLGDKIKGHTIYAEPDSELNGEHSSKSTPKPENLSSSGNSTNEIPEISSVPTIQPDTLGTPGEEGEHLHADDLADEGGEEHVIEIRECTICNQPLKHRTDADVITHIATCASSDWRQVNKLVMGGFVTASQAQRKWYSKVITKIGYGGYKLGANSANILVQDRLTGQINEERMSVYVRLGIRLLYKAMGSREMEKKRIRKMLKTLSVKQGKKYDDPASASQIEGFINFHRLDMAEVLRPINQFKNFNEFFYRALKPDARPCSAPDNQRIVVSPADSRSVVFNTMEDATRIWVKGREYSVERLLGDAYPMDAKRYKGGALGIFRLAPQDYHRFHVPVDGVMGTPKTIEGEYYTVNPMAIRSALDVYGDNVRVVVPIDSVAHGRVMYICIGAMMVGSTVITRRAGEKIKRAEELGYFKFGGSTILLLFEPGVMVFDDDLIENSNGAVETLVRVGMSVGHDPNLGPYRPDMRKDEENITMEDRQEAKRKIEGSLAHGDMH